MRTNAIMKNVDLKACLTLWQYIESYDKVGYEINTQNSAVSPQSDFMKDFYELVGLHMLLFRSSVSPDQDVLETKQLAPVAPKIIKRFDGQFSSMNDSYAEGVAGYISQTGDIRMKPDVPENIRQIIEQIDLAVEIETAYQEELREKELAAQREAEELERRRLEEARIEEQRKAELERIAAEKAEQERRIQEMLEQKRREQKAAEKERERLEQERLALLEEKRKEEEARLARLEEERKQREAEEAARKERQRIAEEKQEVRSEFGIALGIKADNIVAKTVEQPEPEPEPEDPAEIARRAKQEQQRREKERAEAERAQRLKAERKYFESKLFEKIRREYSRNPFWMLVRLIRHILAVVFGIIPEDADRPDYKELRERLMKKREEKKQEQSKRIEMEAYYKKYAQTFKYRTMRKIQDRKFMRKRMKERKNKPRPVYKSRLTPEQQAAVQKEMEALYREYRVSTIEHIRRWFNSEIQKYKAWKNELKENDKKFLNRAVEIIAIVILVAATVFSVYVTINAITGNPVSVFGFTVLKVETGSMEPALHVGDYIIVKSCDPASLKEGDIISFYSEQEDIEGLLVTHRIKEVLNDGTFVTKGDANPITDSVNVSKDRIYGVYVRKSGFYMWMGSFADTNKLYFMLVILPLVLVSLYELRSVIKIGKKANEESDEEKQAEAEASYEKRMRDAIEAEKKRLAEENYKAEDDEVKDT